MLIRTRRHRAEDLEHWDGVLERIDAVNARRLDLDALAARSVDVIRRFAEAGACYVGTSWGKDSLTVVHLMCRAGLHLPVVWVRVDGWDNPDSPLVRDAFCARYDIDYHEITVTEDEDGARVDTRMRDGESSAEITEGFAEAARRFGDRYVSGIRAAESGPRRQRMRHWGETSPRTCAPIGWWSTDAVFAYLHAEELPAHPAYGYTLGGTFDRARLRVSAVGGHRGQEFGRGELERAYYPDILASAFRRRT